MEDIQNLIRISGLIARQKYGKLSKKENEELSGWLEKNKDKAELYSMISEETFIAGEIEAQGFFNADRAYRNIKNNIYKKISLISLNILKYAAAIILLFVISYLFYSRLNKKTTVEIATLNIKPGEQKAILITEDKQMIELGKTAEKKVFRLKNTRAFDTSSVITFETTDQMEAEKYIPGYNELIVPLGGEYTLVLSDGSKVMLNSGSRLKFPEIFSRDARIVNLEGEAYFDIKKSNVPFIVKSNELDITVYGTKFNISAYPGDMYAHTTLVEGSVGVTCKNQAYKLIPGDQALYSKSSNAVSVSKVDVGLYISWTKGLFSFENEPLDKILTKLSRWYNFEIQYEDEKLKNEPFTGEIKRYDQISKILEMISLASNIRFKTEGNKIVVF